jgi:HK97 family phage prohead protease
MPKNRPSQAEDRLYFPGAEIRMEDGKIRGYAAVFNSESYNEVVKPGAFAKTLKDGADVRALWNHDPNIVLGRTKAGTLRLSEDDRGLVYEIDPPSWAGDYIETIQRGDVTQSSFAFRAIKVGYVDREGKRPLRELQEVALLDVSPVTYPWYPDTEVSVKDALSGIGFDPEEFVETLADPQAAELIAQCLRSLKPAGEPTLGTTPEGEPAAACHSEEAAKRLSERYRALRLLEVS